MNSKKKRTRKTTGISRRSLLATALAAWPALGVDSYAVIAGTVFRESGHAFAGAEVVLTPLNPSKKNKKQSTRANGRGEFAFRVPAAPAEFDLSVAIEGYRPQSKRVKIVADERIDENFLLDRLTKEK